MKIIEYGRKVKTYRTMCPHCETKLELCEGDLTPVQDQNLTPTTMQVGCPGCHTVFEIAARELPHALLGPVKR